MEVLYSLSENNDPYMVPCVDSENVQETNFKKFQKQFFILYFSVSQLKKKMKK